MDGKALLLRDDYSDGLIECLRTRPVKAILFTECKVIAYEKASVKKYLKK